MTLSVIAAVSENGVIGRAGALPWRLSADLKRFKALTMGRTIVMGRKTFESIGRLLPGRRSVVLSRDSSYRASGAETARSLDDALRLAAEEEEVFVIGGEAVFREALARADRVHLTRVHARVEGDAFFPEESLRAFRLCEEERRPADEKNEHPASFQVWERTR